MDREPTLIIGAATALIALAIAFGAPVTEQQKESIIGAVIALIPVVLAIRQSVFSPATTARIEATAARTGHISPELTPPKGNVG